MRPLHFALVALALSLAGCSGASCPTVRYTNAQAALAAHEARRSPAVSLRAEARVDQRGSEGRIRGTVLMFVERPDHIRFDAMTQFGPAAVLTSDGTRFQLMDLRENRYLEGPTCPSNIARLLGIPMSGEDITRFVLGDSPRIEAEDQSIECTGDGTYEVRLRAVDGARQELEFSVPSADRQAPPEEQRLRLVRSQVFDADGESRWRATFEDYRDVDGDGGEVVSMPHTVHFVGQGADTLVRFRSIDLNAEIPPGAFVQEVPPGLSAETVVCED